MASGRFALRSAVALGALVLAVLVTWPTAGPRAEVASAPAAERPAGEVRPGETVAGEIGRLVYLVDEEGWRRLMDLEAARDFFLLSTYLESERFLTFCAVASIAAALNSLDVPRPLDPMRFPFPFFTQENVFTLANEQVKSFESVVTQGLTLAEIEQFLGNLGARGDAMFAASQTPDGMRAAIREGVDDPGARVLVNYDRAVLGQDGAGHVSPIGAYDPQTDSVLVLDVARYKYPPVWVPLPLLFDAMRGSDPGSGRSRGIVTVRAAG